jgi:hypothetical protein
VVFVASFPEGGLFMNSKQRNAIRHDLVEGSPELQRQAVNEHKPRLQQDMVRMQEEAGQLKAEFKADLQARAGRYVEGQPRPTALSQDMRKVWLALVGAWLLAAVHLALDALVALTMGMNPFVFVLFGLVLVFSAKAGLLFLLDDPRPQRVQRRVVRYVLAPSFAVTVLSVMVLYFGRTALGALALLLLGMVNVALGCLSLGALGLSAALFLLAHLFGWSKSAAQKYRALETEAVETRRVLELLLSVERELQPVLPAVAQPVIVTPAATTPRAPHAEDQFKPFDSPTIRQAKPLVMNGHGRFGQRAQCHWMPVLLACVCALALSGCQQGASGLTKPDLAQGAVQAASAQNGKPVTSTPVATTEESVWVEVLVDWSLSESAQPLAEAAQKVAARLPQAIELLRATHFAAYQFGSDGWEARELAAREFPALGQATPTEGELLLKGMQTARQTAAHTAYQAAVREQLQGITAATFLPPTNTPEPRCTDIQGALERLAESGSARPELAILITDFAETCAPKLIPVAASHTALVVVLLPVKAEESAAASGRDQFAQRRAEVARVYPGAVVIPHFGELLPAVKKAWEARKQGKTALKN